MAETETGQPRASALAAVLLVIVGGEFIRIAIDAAMSGEKTGAILPGVVGIALVAASGFRNHLGPRFTALVTAASNVWVWSAVLSVIFAYEAIPLAIIRVEVAGNLLPPRQIASSYSAHKFSVTSTLNLVDRIGKSDNIEKQDWPLLITAAPENRQMVGDLWAIIRHAGMTWQLLSPPDNARNLDAPILAETGAGIIIHGDNPLAAKMFGALDACFVVKKTTKLIQELETYYSKNADRPVAGHLTWIEIGTGSPWRVARQNQVLECYEPD